MNLITVTEVAQLLRMSSQNVVRMAKLGQLPVAATLATGERLCDLDVVEKLVREREESRP